MPQDFVSQCLPAHSYHSTPTLATWAPPVTQTCGAHPALLITVSSPWLEHSPSSSPYQISVHKSQVREAFLNPTCPFSKLFLCYIAHSLLSFSGVIPRQPSNICWWVYFIKHYHPHYTEFIFQCKIQFMSSNILINKLLVHIFDFLVKIWVSNQSPYQHIQEMVAILFDQWTKKCMLMRYFASSSVFLCILCYFILSEKMKRSCEILSEQQLITTRWRQISRVSRWAARVSKSTIDQTGPFWD